MKKYGKFLLIFIFLITFCLILHFTLNDNLKVLDTNVYNFIIDFKSNIMTNIMKVISFLCSTIFLILLIAVIYLFTRKKNYLIYMSLNLLFANTLNSLIKIIVKRPRPIDLSLIKETGFSFPSGHSMCGVAFYGLLIYIIWSLNIKKSLKYTLVISLSLLVLLIGISRIYLGVHYPSDVLGGFALGISYLLVFISVFKNDIIK